MVASTTRQWDLSQTQTRSLGTKPDLQGLPNGQQHQSHSNFWSENIPQGEGTFPGVRTQGCPSLEHPDPKSRRPLKVTTSTLSCTQKYTSSQCSSHINGITCTKFLENITGKFFSYLLRGVPLSSVGFNLKYCKSRDCNLSQ